MEHVLNKRSSNIQGQSLTDVNFEAIPSKEAAFHGRAMSWHTSDSTLTWEFFIQNHYNNPYSISLSLAIVWLSNSQAGPINLIQHV